MLRTPKLSPITRTTGSSILRLEGADSEANRLLREGIVGCINLRERGAEIEPSGRLRDYSSPNRVEKRGDPLRAIRNIVDDACRLRDSVPDADLQRYDCEELYGKVQGAVAVLVYQGIEESDARRAAARRKGGVA